MLVYRYNQAGFNPNEAFALTVVRKVDSGLTEVGQFAFDERNGSKRTGTILHYGSSSTYE